MSNYLNDKQRTKLAYWAGAIQDGTFTAHTASEFCPEVNDEDFEILLDAMEQHVDSEKFKELLKFSVAIACIKYISATGFHVPTAVLYPNTTQEPKEGPKEGSQSKTSTKAALPPNRRGEYF